MACLFPEHYFSLLMMTYRVDMTCVFPEHLLQFLALSDSCSCLVSYNYSVSGTRAREMNASSMNEQRSGSAHLACTGMRIISQLSPCLAGRGVGVELSPCDWTMQFDQNWKPLLV